MRFLTLVILVFLTMPGKVNAADRFELFVAEPLSTVEADVTVYAINGGDRIMARLNDQLKRDGVTSEKEGARYVTTALKKALSDQAIGLMKAAQYQLRYFPALVIDGRYVVYGTTTVRDYYRLQPNE